MEKQGRIGFVPLMAGMAVFVVLGVPLVAYLWETLNELLSGSVDPIRLLVSVPLALVFTVLLVLLSRRVQSWEARHVD